MSLLKRLWLVLGAAAALVTVTTAQITVPNTFTPGTTISSTAMNANFTELGSKSLNRTGGTMTGTLTAQQVTPSTTAAYDLGTSAVKFRDAFLSRNLTVGGTLTTGSGAVALTDATGKITALSSTYVASLDGSGLTTLNGSNISSGTVAVARLGSGTPSNVNFLRGDGTWASVINTSEFDAGNSSTAVTLNYATNGPLQKVTRTASATYTLTAPTYPGTVVTKFIHTSANTTAFTVTFSPVPKWPGGTAPTWTNTASGTDIVSLYWDGATWYGVQSANYQ